MGVSPAKQVYRRLQCTVSVGCPLMLGQLPIAVWAGFGDCICHDLASLLTGTMPFVYQNVPDARECNKATC
jgi:hypothetical protein